MKRRILNSPIIDYAYEIYNEEEVQTYLIVKGENDTIQACKYCTFYLSMYGDALLQKLEGKGYLPMNEIKEKYTLSEIQVHPKQKIKWKKRKRP